ncbi:MAG: DUF58 domain-containing protein [Planctomycetota bacterium]
MTIPKETLRQVRRLQIRTSRHVDAILTGSWHSAFKGRGMEFEEVRPYQMGDDVRAIDWNVTARSDQPYVKLFREERQLAVQLLVDTSSSMRVGSSVQTKRAFAAELAGLLAFSAIDNGDQVGLTLFSDRIVKHVPLGGSSRHAVRIIRDILVGEEAMRDRVETTNLVVALEHLTKTTHQATVAFLISDFVDVALSEELTRAMRVAASRHEIIPIQVRDAHDQTLPNTGLTYMRDAETGHVVLVDTSSRRLRRQFDRWQEQSRQLWQTWYGKLKLRPLTLTLGEDPVGPLRNYFDR